MAFHYLSNVPYEKAFLDYMNIIKDTGVNIKTEKIKVTESLGRITSDAVYAKICTPHYNACAMDGIAVIAASTYGATETTPVHLNASDYMYVDTGDELITPYDSVVMIEDVIQQEQGNVTIYHAVVPWQNVRQIGEDISANDMILASNSKITPAEVGAMLACGIMEVTVIKSPVIGIIPTGDEVVMPTTQPEDGQVIEFNSSIFRGMILEKNAIPKVYPIVKDEKQLILQAVQTAISECDIVLLNAGSSAGRDDYAECVIQQIGKVIYHGIAMKPGKPAVLGLAGNVPIIGIPGYPVSGIVIIQEFLYPIIGLWFQQHDFTEKNVIKATLSKSYVSSVKYKEFVRTKLGYINGKVVATPINKGAGVISSVIHADGIIVVPQNLEGYQQGDLVDVQLLRDFEYIKNMLVVIGSHDPLIDEIADIIKKKWSQFGVSSSHVGSMGGIMALKRKEAHLGGIHILDGSTGRYNIDQVNKFFPNQEVVLIEGVKRLQGIMVSHNNPKNIKNIKNLATPSISYVNRQKGSGTRILLDYLLKKEGIDASSIYGYSREEYTHTNVAAIVASGNADAGMGIYSAANIYGLDFIPICEENYDFIVDKTALSIPVFQKFIEVLKSSEFLERINDIGGYRLEHPGRILIER